MRLKTAFILGLWSAATITALSPQAAAQEGFVYDDKGSRDPFWPLVNSSGAIITYKTDLTVKDMFLEGIIVDTQGRNMAIINGMVVQADDTIGLFRVEEIGANEVTLSKGEESYTLRLNKEE